MIDLDLTGRARELLGAFPTEFLNLERDEQVASVALYRLLAAGCPVDPQRLAAAVGIPVQRIGEMLDGWPGVYRDDGGGVVGYWGLGLAEMDHRFEVVGGCELFTWCAWDTLFIPEILGKAARVRSACPVSGLEIRLMVTPTGIEGVEPAGTSVSFLRPEDGKISEDVIGNFCRYVHFFCSEEAGLEWSAEYDGTFVLSLQEAYHIGKVKNLLQYGEGLFAGG